MLILSKLLKWSLSPWHYYTLLWKWRQRRRMSIRVGPLHEEQVPVQKHNLFYLFELESRLKAPRANDEGLWLRLLRVSRENKDDASIIIQSYVQNQVSSKLPNQRTTNIWSFWNRGAYHVRVQLPFCTKGGLIVLSHCHQFTSFNLQ